MKVRIITLLSLMSCISLLTSCNKEELNSNIPAAAIRIIAEGHADHNAKTSVSGSNVYWVDGNQVKIYVGDKDHSYSPSVLVAGGGSAYINASYDESYAEEHEMTYIPAPASGSSNEMRAYYPASIINDNQSFGSTPGILFPSSYTYDGSSQEIELPMAAKETYPASALRFKQLTAAINVNMKNSMTSALTIDKVVVKTVTYRLNNGSSYVNIDFAEEDMGLTATEETSDDSKLAMTVNVSGMSIASNESGSVQVPILPIDEDVITIEVYCHDGSGNNYLYSKEATCPALARNKMLEARVELVVGSNMSNITPTLNINDLGTSYNATGNVILSGTLSSKDCTIKISKDVIVTLNGVTATDKYLVIEATGDATLNLSGENTLTGKAHNIRSASGKKLTIQGDGSLTISTTGYNYAAIGSAGNTECGNIVISASGVINATGNTLYNTAGIGCGGYGKCGNITIDGGTVIANGSGVAAGIGSAGYSSPSYYSQCGAIAISGANTHVKATKGTSASATACIGKGHGSSTCGTVTIGGDDSYGTTGAGTDVSTFKYNWPSSK